MISIIYDGYGVLCNEKEIGKIQEHFRLCYLDDIDEFRLFAFGTIDVKELRTNSPDDGSEVIYLSNESGEPIAIKIEPRIGIFRHESGCRLRVAKMDNAEELKEMFSHNTAPLVQQDVESTENPLTKSERTTYQNIIVSLLDYIRGNVPLAEKHPSFTSEADMIAAIEKHFKGYQGLSETTLKRKFAEAKKRFGEQ